MDDELEIVLRCQCGLPYATIRNGCLWIQSRHRGVKHTNGLPLALLARLAVGEPVSEEQLRPVVIESDAA